MMTSDEEHGCTGDFDVHHPNKSLKQNLFRPNVFLREFLAIKDNKEEYSLMMQHVDETTLRCERRERRDDVTT